MRPLIELVKLGSHGALTRTRKGQSARNIRRCFLRFRLPWTSRKRTDRSRYRIDEDPTAVHRYPLTPSPSKDSFQHAPPSTSNRNNDPRLLLSAQSYLPHSKKLASDIGMKGGNVLEVDVLSSLRNLASFPISRQLGQRGSLLAYDLTILRKRLLLGYRCDSLRYLLSSRNY